MTRHFAVDLGAESGRCIVGTLENGKLTTEELCRFPTQVCQLRGEYYWNIFRYYDEILKGLQTYVQTYGPELDSIGVDTWGCDYCLLDETGFLKALPKSYRRMTAQQPYAEMEETFGKFQLYQRHGIQFLDFNTLNQLLWERAQDAHYFDNVTGLLFMGDSLHYLLGAPAVCEYSTASISQLVNTSTQTWDAEILHAFGLPEAVATKLVFAGDVIGTLSDSIADAVGLRRGVKLVAPAVHDTASASVAVPAEGQNWASISSGTWSLASVELDAPVNNAQSYAMNISNSAGVLGKSLFLKNIMGLWIIQQCKYRWNEADPALTYSRIVELAEAAEPFYAWIDPDDARFFQPGDMPSRICYYLHASGQRCPEEHDIGQIARIVYESLAMKYRHVFTRISAVSGRRIDALHITGGGSNNRMLDQFTANAMNVPVIAGPAECSAMGNLLMQAYGCGALSSLDAIRQVVRDSAVLQTFQPQNISDWETAYAAFCNYIPKD